jgi:DNA-binding FadR family transcriptional regulator
MNSPVPLTHLRNFHGAAVDALGAAIVAGHYAIGQSLPVEPDLCKQLGVSRTVVREAVKTLAAKGLVSTGPKVGTKVLEVDQWNWFDPSVIDWQARVGLDAPFLRDLLDLRRVVEPAAVGLAAQRATPADLRELRIAYEAMAAAVDGVGDYVTADLHFHQTILRACRNRMLTQMSNALAALLRASFEVSTQRSDGPRTSLPLHKAVLNALEKRDETAAVRAIQRIIDGADDDIRVVLKTGHSPRRLTATSQRRPLARRKAAA